MSRSRGAHLALLLATLALAGCTTLTHVSSYAPLLWGLPRSPVRSSGEPLHELGVPLDSGTACFLHQINVQQVSNRICPCSTSWSGECRIFEGLGSSCRLSPVRSADTVRRFAGLCKLVPKETLVLVAVSGGGARAASLAYHAMSDIEQHYEALARSLGPDFEQHKPLFHTIDGWSTVSGGSLFAYLVAEKQIGLGCCGGYDTFFAEGANQWQERVRSLGGATARRVLDFPVTFFSKYSYANTLAAALESGPSYSGTGPLGQPPLMADLPAGGPHYFFNATALGPGDPFVLTQNLVHPSVQDVPRSTARLDLERRIAGGRFLGRSWTLEDLGQDPLQLPISRAAAASAAFPISVPPVRLRRYQFDTATWRGYATTDFIELTDGGVYDNSGLLTLVDLVEQMLKPPEAARQRRVILLAINAESSSYNKLPTYVAQESSWLDRIWIGLPLEVGALPFDSAGLIHFTNKRRAEELAINRLKTLLEAANKTPDTLVANKKPDNLFFFPVNLTQLSGQDAFQVGALSEPGESGGPQRGTSNGRLFEQVQEIQTDYVLTSDQDLLLGQAASHLVFGAQPSGWRVGPTCPVDGKHSEIRDVATAMSFTLLRSQANWREPQFKAADVSRWCKPVMVETAHNRRIPLEQIRAGYQDSFEFGTAVDFSEDGSGTITPTIRQGGALGFLIRSDVPCARDGDRLADQAAADCAADTFRVRFRMTPLTPTSRSNVPFTAVDTYKPDDRSVVVDITLGELHRGVVLAQPYNCDPVQSGWIERGEWRMTLEREPPTAAVGTNGAGTPVSGPREILASRDVRIESVAPVNCPEDPTGVQVDSGLGQPS